MFKTWWSSKDLALKITFRTCLVIALFDLAFRVLPSWPEQSPPQLKPAEATVSQRVPTSSWQSWFSDFRVAEVTEQANQQELTKATKSAAEKARPKQSGVVKQLQLEDSSYVLWGIFGLEKKGSLGRFAVLKGQNKKTIRVEVGSILGGYTVTEIHATSLRLSADGGERLVELKLFKKAT